jgi:hypothetical protein
MQSKVKTFSLIVLMFALLSCLAAENKGWQLVQSLAVPGLSQIRSDRNYGYAMLTSEVGIISTLLYLGTEVNLKTEKYYEYALKYAQVQVGDYPDQYFRDLSRYNSSGFEAGGYNAQVRQRAIQLYPADPLQQQVYIDANAYSEDYAWNWESVENRSSYSKIRVQTQDLRDYGKMAVGVLIVNHLISGIDVLRYFSETQRSHVYLDIKDRHPMLMLNVEW